MIQDGVMLVYHIISLMYHFFIILIPCHVMYVDDASSCQTHVSYHILQAARQKMLSQALQHAANGGSFADAFIATSTPELSDEETSNYSDAESESSEIWSEYDGRVGGAIVDEVLGMEESSIHVTSPESLSQSTHSREDSIHRTVSPANRISSNEGSSPTSTHSFTIPAPLDTTTRPHTRSQPSSPAINPSDPHHLQTFRSSITRIPSKRDTSHNSTSHPHRESKPIRELHAIYAPKCIALLSTYPFLLGFRQFLTQLYRLSLTPLHIPIEHWVTNFLLETPLPPLGECVVQYHIADQIISFARAPPNQPFSIHHFPIHYLFECMELENIITLVECVLCERRILLLSNKLSLLTIVGQTLISLIFPFQWQHVFIPLLPKALIDFLNAPMPFM